MKHRPLELVISSYPTTAKTEIGLLLTINWSDAEMIILYSGPRVSPNPGKSWKPIFLWLQYYGNEVYDSDPIPILSNGFEDSISPY